ncbi:hypothetical protein [Paractinoplanes atraurantiacus]|uniref:Uncharacterized protein n=1 Tax=Paractinoplanes atraurantiacus TaxID=1036182 RepID=A0A285GNU9_9ACTN|nr:hypothetical protein [Actinoplanes atraurantiacus]SNY24176.1 hypothetical protein SAMN05421748_102149 [Actinoplanes atraurantiacus]
MPDEKAGGWPGDLIKELLMLAAVTAVTQARPHVEKWLIERAVPAAVSTLASALNRIPLPGAARPAVSPAPVVQAPRTEAEEVAASLEAARAALGTEEAQSRFLAALVTRLYSEDQLRTLREARTPEVDSLVEALTTVRLRSAVAALLAESGDGEHRYVGQPGNYLVAEPNGRFTVFTATGTVAWTQTSASAGGLLRLQDDRNIVIYYSGTHPAAAWASHTYL